jgi:polyisoprenoid-binding protein YceI
MPALVICRVLIELPGNPQRPPRHSADDRRVKRPIVIGVAAVIAVVALVAGGGYIYYFSGLRTSPGQLGLSASPAPTSSSPTPATGLAGRWIVGSGSVAGFRVKELFVGQTSKHEAVARTSSISGELAVSGDTTAGYRASDMKITVDLVELHSVDQVAGRDVSQRDGVVARQLSVRSFSTASFTALSASVPAGITLGQVDVTAPGKLTIHGVTKDVTVKAKAQVLGDKVEIAGSVLIDMNDYGVSPPQVPFVTVESATTLEFDIFLTKSA